MDPKITQNTFKVLQLLQLNLIFRIIYHLYEFSYLEKYYLIELDNLMIYIVIIRLDFEPLRRLKNNLYSILSYLISN